MQSNLLCFTPAVWNWPHVPGSVTIEDQKWTTQLSNFWIVENENLLSSKTIFQNLHFLLTEIWNLLFASDWRSKISKFVLAEIWIFTCWTKPNFHFGPNQISKPLLAEFWILLFGPNHTWNWAVSEVAATATATAVAHCVAIKDVLYTWWRGNIAVAGALAANSIHGLIFKEDFSPDSGSFWRRYRVKILT